VVKKDAARDAYENGIKEDEDDISIRMYYMRFIRNNPKVTPDQRADMGLPLLDTVKTAEPGAGGAKQTDLVAGTIRSMAKLKHISEVFTPDEQSKALGEGVEAIEVWITFVEAGVTAIPDISVFKLDGDVKRGAVYP
jgi:hypothetical protein